MQRLRFENFTSEIRFSKVCQSAWYINDIIFSLLQWYSIMVFLCRYKLPYVQLSASAIRYLILS